MAGGPVEALGYGPAANRTYMTNRTYRFVGMITIPHPSSSSSSRGSSCMGSGGFTGSTPAGRGGSFLSSFSGWDLLGPG
jgi:hypothetical protein